MARVKSCDTCDHPADHPDAFQRVMLGDCVGCRICDLPEPRPGDPDYCYGCAQGRLPGGAHHPECDFGTPIR